MLREVINVTGAPPAVGPYSHAVRVQGTLHFLSGVIPLKPTGELVVGPIGLQTQQVFANIKTILDGLGLTFENVVKVTVFLSSMEHFAEMNEVYATKFTAPYPARSTVAVAGLPRGTDVEIEITAIA